MCVDYNLMHGMNHINNDRSLRKSAVTFADFVHPGRNVKKSRSAECRRNMQSSRADKDIDESDHNTEKEQSVPIFGEVCSQGLNM